MECRITRLAGASPLDKRGVWCMPLGQVGYMPVSLPSIQAGSASLKVVSSLVFDSSQDAQGNALPGTSLFKGEWR